MYNAVHVQLCEVLVLGCLCAKMLLLRVWCCSVSDTTMCVPNRSGCHIRRGLVCLISGVVLFFWLCVMAVMHVSSFPVMPITQSDPVGCSAICLQTVVIGDWLSLCCFRATGGRIIMPHHCCVPGCTSNSCDKTVEAISFHSFPKDRALVREWIAKIRRDVGDHSTALEAEADQITKS